MSLPVRPAILLLLLATAAGAAPAPKAPGPAGDPAVMPGPSTPMTSEPKWTFHTGYLRRFFETVNFQWNGILAELKVQPPRPSRVVVRFLLDASGRIAQILHVESTSSEEGSRACLSAIAVRESYERWTEEMRQDLGERQELTLTFDYR